MRITDSWFSNIRLVTLSSLFIIWWSFSSAMFNAIVPRSPRVELFLTWISLTIVNSRADGRCVPSLWRTKLEKISKRHSQNASLRLILSEKQRNHYYSYVKHCENKPICPLIMDISWEPAGIAYCRNQTWHIDQTIVRSALQIRWSGEAHVWWIFLVNKQSIYMSAADITAAVTRHDPTR